MGCSALLGFGDYEVVGGDGGEALEASSDAGFDGATEEAGCIDTLGFNGRGCFRCPPTNNEELLSACTSAAFETFDNVTRIPGFDPAKRRPPLVDAGPPLPAFDAGTSTPTDAGGGTVDPCPVATRPNPVFVLGATGFPLDVVQRAMGTKATMFYAEKGSCEGIDAIVTPGAQIITAGTKVAYFDATSGTRTECTVEEDHPVDVGTSALFAETCKLSLPPDVQDLLGPVNPVGFAVPATSDERVISAEAAYRVYGFVPSGVAPWDLEELVFRRRPSSGNQTTVALTLGLPNEAMRGRDSNGSSNMLRALQSSPQPKKTIGISSSEIVDVNRSAMKWLAYQHFAQPAGFYPDSSPTTFDRRNVRDGHYFVWIPLHVYARVSAGEIVGAPGQAVTRDADAVKSLALVMTSRAAAPNPSVDLFGALGRLGNVPQCAMRVTRKKEGAPLEPFKPALACDCAFEAAVPNGAPPPSCKRCTDASACTDPARPSCNFGYCE